MWSEKYDKILTFLFSEELKTNSKHSVQVFCLTLDDSQQTAGP